MSDNCCAPAHCAAFLKRKPNRPSEAGALLKAGKDHTDGSTRWSTDVASDVDILVAAGAHLPKIYETRFRRWACLAVFSVVSALASGPMSMWPTLEPILIQEHVFQGPSQLAQLSQVFAFTIGVLTMSSLPVGIAYDSYGPRCLAVVGSLLFSVFAICMGLAIRYQSLNWMLYYAYPIALLFGFGANYGAYGYQWLLSDSQNTVNSIIMATQALSDTLVLVCVWLHNVYGMGLWTYFYWLSFFAVFTAAVCMCIVPSRKDHFQYAGIVLAHMATLHASSEGYGAITIEKTTETCETGGRSSIKTSGWRWWDNVKSVYITACNYPVEHLLFVSGCCTLYMFTWYPTVQMYPFYFAMFGKVGAQYLVNTFAIVYGIFGAISVLFAGRMLDWLGMPKAILFNNILVFLIWITIMVDTVYSQLACQVFMTFSGSLFGLFAYRFCMLYAPPEIFGTYTGVLMTLLGVFQLTLSSITDYAMSRVHGYEVLLVHIMVSFFGVVTFATWTGLVCWWQWHPLPGPGSITRFSAGLPEESEYAALGDTDDGDGWF